jgi:hypothetical protein
MAGIGSHQSARMDSEEWLTPPWLLKKLPHFNLDPCAAIDQPWSTADQHLTREDDGLSRRWWGHVFCNPPYGKHTATWLERMADHNNGIALIFARTDTVMFQKWVFQRAEGILFLAGRLTFCRTDGTPAAHNSGGPSCLVGYGHEAEQALQMSTLNGQYVDLYDPTRHYFWSTS